MFFRVDQSNLATVATVIGNVESAPYRLVPAYECEGCLESDADLAAFERCGLTPPAHLKDHCHACYKCCPCERCDRHRGPWTLLVCPECGCRVWWTSCAPYLCICVEGCDCILCCRALDAFDFPPGREQGERLVEAGARLDKARKVLDP